MKYDVRDSDRAASMDDMSGREVQQSVLYRSRTLSLDVGAERIPILYDLQRFMRSCGLGMVISAVFLLVGYGTKMFGNTYSIDTQAIIEAPEHQYDAWLILDRFGLLVLKKTLGLYWYNNALASVLTPILFYMFVWLWAYVLYRSWTFPQKFRPLAFVFPALSGPIFAEQLGFLLQSVEVAACLIGLVVAGLLLEEAAVLQTRSRWCYVVGALVLCTLAFSCYLAMTTVFALLIASILLCRSAGGVRIRNGWLFLVSLGVFIGSYVLYKILNAFVKASLSIDASGYIDDMFRWGKDSVGLIASNIAHRGYAMLVGKGIFYTGCFGACIAIFLIAVVYRMRQREHTWLTVIMALCICASPLMMVIILGGRTTYRTELTFPLASALALAFSFSWLATRRLVTVPAVLAIVALSMQGMFTVNRLYYTEATVYAENVATVNSVYERIARQRDDMTVSPRIVFIGAAKTEGNNSVLPRDQLELIGYPILSIAFSSEHGSWNMVQFMRNQGLPVDYPQQGDFAVAERESRTMTHWPAAGSVRVQNDLAIVNF